MNWPSTACSPTPARRPTQSCTRSSTAPRPATRPRSPRPGTSVLTVEGKTLTADLHTKTATFDEFVAAADHVVIEDAYRRACRALSPDVARTYAERLADADDDATTPTMR